MNLMIIITGGYSVDAKIDFQIVTHQIEYFTIVTVYKK